MGACLCKDQASETDEQETHRVDTHVAVDVLPGCASFRQFVSPSTDELVLQTLGAIGALVENEQEPPPSMLKLHSAADKEEGWIQVVISMINVIPINDPLGPAVITLLLDDCPLPTKESVIKLSNIFNFSAQLSEMGRTHPTHHRNICIVLGCLAEKLAGPSSIAILTKGALDYLMRNLEQDADASVILFSLIALEKFAETSENKVTIKKRLQNEDKNPLLLLERWIDSTDYLRSQVGFCAQWCLDNLFIVEGRKFSYQTVELSGINVMLNTKDVSEYLKISPNGLEARCDAYSFESVRCTFQVDTGIWYYETLVITPGVMQIGWATKDSAFLNHEGYGIGDDEFSLAYDGCRRFIWHNARNEMQSHPCWRPGDILGCLLDLTNLEIIFYMNGVPLKPCRHVFNTARSGFFAAASFMAFQQCKFNFGSQPFQFPPSDKNFQSFNDHASLKPEDKIVLPRHVRLEQLRNLCVREDSCTLCFDKHASVQLLPCGHKEFCTSCATQLAECPMCRCSIEEMYVDNT